MYTAVFVITLFMVNYCTSSLTVDYIQNIINENVASTKNFTFPTKYEDFEKGTRSSKINNFEERFDFIIVGAGSAGSVLATRLSEIPFWKILLIEAGSEEELFNRIPGMVLYALFSKRNWGFVSTPQKNCCLGMDNQMCMIPRGKGIGGSSSVNLLGYFRGNPGDYSKWAGSGCPDWSYSKILNYFRKSENSQIKGDAGFHGYDGFLNVEYALPPLDTLNNVIKANEELGQKILDYNGCEQIGVSKIQTNTIRGLRDSTGTAFLDHARKRENLRIITEALVTEILIDKESKAAQGVIFVKNNQKFRVKANLEVIVSGGAINSPQLLMLSGIGPEKHLKELGIDLTANLPVGRKFIDHVGYPMVFHTNYSKDNSNMTLQIEQFIRGEGILTNPFNSNGVSFANSDNSSISVPDLEFYYIQFTNPTDLLGRINNFNNKINKQFIENINFTSDMLVYIILLHPESRGKITLKTKDPTHMPNIDVNMLDEPSDIKKLVVGIERIMELLKTKAFRQINATLIDIPICETYQKYSFEYWECMLRHMSVPFYHPCGTCNMGTNSKGAVVDCEFKVYGTKNLRVVDASVFPVSISGHLNAVTIMTAEKAADLIKNTYGVGGEGQIGCH